MPRSETGRSGDTEPEDAPREASAAELFERLYSGVADIIGSPATATLMRRALRNAAAGNHALNDVVLLPKTLGFQYSPPDRWDKVGDEQGLRDVRALYRALRALLVEMTGPVVIHRLSADRRLQGLTGPTGGAA